MVEARVVTKPQDVCTIATKPQCKQMVEALVVTRPKGMYATVTKPQCHQ